MKRKLLLLLFCFPLLLSAQQNDLAFYKMLKKNKNLRPLLKRSQKYKIQIIYTSFTKEFPRGSTHYFNYDPALYFYPASTVKFPAALSALEKLNSLNINRNASYTSQSTISGYDSVPANLDDINEVASIEKYIQKVFLFSDNDAFNRLYDFIGLEEFNKDLVGKGYLNSKINHRLAITLSAADNRQNPSFQLGENYQEDLRIATPPKSKKNSILLGEKYFKQGLLINEPMDFSTKNRFDLLDQHRMIQSLFFPESLPAEYTYDIRAKDLDFLKNMMQLVPRNAGSTKKEIPDGSNKFLLYADRTENMPTHLKIYNKIGGAYGFLLDNAFIDDSKNNVQFILSAVIYCNENQTLNDDTYQYDQIGLPFLGELGRHIHEHEINLLK